MGSHRLPPANPAESTVLAASTAALLTVVRRRGVDTSALAGTQADPSPDQRLTVSDMARIWDASEAATGDQAIGLAAAANVPFGAYGALDALSVAAGSVRESFVLTSRYLRFAHAAALMGVGQSRRTLAIEFQTPAIGAHAPRSVQFTFALLLARSRAACGVDWWPARVDLAEPMPLDPRPYLLALGPGVRFGQKANRILLSREDGARRHPLHDRLMATSLQDHLETLLAGQSPRHGVVARCAERLRAAPVEDCDLKAVSRHLGLSARSLQRELAQCGETFRGLRDAALEARARDRLLKGERTASVSALLGFSETAAFYRAFGRWTGATPAGYRPRRPD